MAAKIVEGDGDHRHGTANGYNNLKCRCPECTSAWAMYHLQIMHADPERMKKHARAQRARWLAKKKLLEQENKNLVPITDAIKQLKASK